MFRYYLYGSEFRDLYRVPVAGGQLETVAIWNSENINAMVGFSGTLYIDDRGGLFRFQDGMDMAQPMVDTGKAFVWLKVVGDRLWYADRGYRLG